MMRIDIITLFPEMCDNVLSESIIGRARKNQKVDIYFHQLRDFAFNKHKKVDDTPYGGGMGMVLMPEPLSKCLDFVISQLDERPRIIYMSPKGSVLTQKKIKTLLNYNNLCLICGHYEGIDQRIIDKYVDEEISIGDYVLTGGELPALVLTDSLCRMLDGVLSEKECYEDESHYNGLLEYPQYTKPALWNDMEVPEVLLSGHHLNIANWRKEQSIRLTENLRPDMYQKWLENNKSKLDL